MREIINCIKNHRYKLETLLPLITSQPAKILKFKDKGYIGKGFDASFMVLDKKSFELIHVISNGHFMVRDGELVVREKFLEESNRLIYLRGDDVET